MKSNHDIDSFFTPIRLEHPVSDADYERVKPYIESFTGLARIANLSLYLVDYHKREFLYVSPNPLFLCGYSREEVKSFGYDFYFKVVPPEDLKMLMEINEKGFGYFYQQPAEKRSNLFFSYEFRLKHLNNQTYMVNHKITPFALAPDGDMWLSLCVVSLSTKEAPGHFYMQEFDSLNRLEYSFKTKRWKTTQAITLTEREKEVLQLSAQGYTAQDIADRIFVDVSTVKFHKTNIFNKLGVNNMMEAIYFATVNHAI